ncbi:phenylalanine--tRNA ligase subunit beta, partial [Candidatus Saccharibacteria bacterium]|nr:phenylalanine--tRNA ligase subunit beta [Candidatus Saccharibacteria bacterium]
QGADAAPGVSIEDPELCARFTAVVLTDMDETRQSPLYIQSLLARSGVRPVSAAVDVANYLMLLSGQPLHTYDYDKLLQVAGGDQVVGVRTAREGETLALLDGREIALDTSDIVIAAGNTAVGLAGAMGGASTAIDGTTKRVLLEVATFDLYHLRSTQMRHGIFSEAITRFTKGIPAAISMPVTQEAVRLFEEYTGATVSSAIADARPVRRKPLAVEVSVEMINETLGTQYAAEDVMVLLENVGFEVTFNDTVGTVQVPYWREDIHIPEDIIEEVGRLAGFDSINLTLPLRESTAVRPDAFDQLRMRIRQYLVQAGANEVLTYSFVHGDVLQRAGQKPENSYRIVNSISPELQYYRQSLTPSLLGLVHPNVKAGHDSFAVFELNKTHDKSAGLTNENVPVEHDRLALVVEKTEGADQPAFYLAKRYLEYLGVKLGKTFEYQIITGDEADVATAPYEPKHSAVVFDVATGAYVGVVGEYKKAVRKGWKLSDSVAGFEINTRALMAGSVDDTATYMPLSRYPGTQRDICFQVPVLTAYGAVGRAVKEVLSNIDITTSVEPVDIYHSDNADVKNVTVRINMVSHDKTLSQDDINRVVEAVSAHVSTAVNGKAV